jgi:hypothetical protein
MNDWPADDRLDLILSRLAEEELASARVDARALSPHSTTVTTRGLGAFAGLGALAIIVIVAVLALRSVPATHVGGAGESESPSRSESPAASGLLPGEFPSAPASSPPSSPPGGSASPGASSGGPGTFSSTGKMISSDNGTATLLLDGRVLIVGNSATSPELYDPASGTFSPTGAALRDGNFATATRLLDGRVLFVGGNDANTTFNTAQLYDPETGKFSATGSLIAGRMGQTATLLPDGRVLIAGGDTFNYAATGGYAVAMAYHPGSRAGTTARQGMTGPAMLASAEIYDPKTGKFSATGSMTTGRDGAGAVLLADGRVLIAGGGNEGNAPVRSAEIYNPKTGKFTATGSMPTPRYGFSATLLTDGRVLISGGTDGTNPLGTMEAYDPKTGKFTALKPSIPGSASAVLLGDGRVIFIGGYDSAAAKGAGFLTVCELYDPTTDKVSPTGSMAIGRIAGGILLADGRVLVAGGFGAGDPPPLDSAEIYQP